MVSASIDLKSVSLNILVPALGALCFFTFAVHALIEGKKTQRTLCFAALYTSGALYFFTELLANIYFPIDARTAKSLNIPFVDDLLAGQNWFRLWWPWSILPSVFFYRFISLVVYSNFGRRGRTLHNTAFGLLALWCLALILSGEINPAIYLTNFDTGGIYYIFFILYTLFALILTLVTLVYSLSKHKPSNSANRRSSLRIFLVVTILSAIGAYIMASAVHEDGSGTITLDHLLKNLVELDLPYWWGEIIFVAAFNIFMIVGVTRSNLIFDRRLYQNTRSWILNLLVLYLGAFAIFVGLCLSRPTVEVYPLFILAFGVLLFFYIFVVLNSSAGVVLLLKHVQAFPNWSNDLVGAYRVNEQELEHNVQNIFVNLCRVLNVEFGSLTPLDTTVIGPRLDYSSPGRNLANEEVAPTNNFELTPTAPSDKLHLIQIAKNVGTPPMGQLVLSRRSNGQAFTTLDEAILDFAIYQILTLWSTRIVVNRLGRLIDTTQHKLDQLIENTISHYHDDIKAEMKIMADKLETVLLRAEIGDTDIARQDLEYLKELKRRIQHLLNTASEVLQSEDLERPHPLTLSSRGLITALQQDLHKSFESYFASLKIITSLNDENLNLLLKYDARCKLYDAIKEALTNTVKHAKGKDQATVNRSVEAKISLETEPGNILKVEVEDNGVGCDISRVHLSQGAGLAFHHDRMVALGGTLFVSNPSGTPPSGTKISITLPLILPQ